MEYICLDKYASMLLKCLNFTQIEYKRAKLCQMEGFLGDVFGFVFQKRQIIVDYKTQEKSQTIQLPLPPIQKINMQIKFSWTVFRRSLVLTV